MKVIINDNLQLFNVYRINEMMEDNFKNKITFLLFYNQTTYEYIQEFLKENLTINKIEIINNSNEVLSVFSNYTKFERLFHHYNDPETIELTLKEDV